MEKILLEKEEKFNWETPNGLFVNKQIKTPNHIKVYSHEDYAPALYYLYLGSNPENLEDSKDLISGNIYKCKIASMNENSALAYTSSGQTIFIDLKKEKKDAQRLGIQGIDFGVSKEYEATVREISGTYYGSIVECYVQGLKVEFFDQIKESSVAYPARIESVNKGGYLVDISGVKCFVVQWPVL